MKYQNQIVDELDSILDQRWRVVALLASKKPISISTNQPNKTHPISNKDNPYKRLHAEVSCIRKAPKSKLKNSVLYVWRFGRDGQYKIAIPCDICMPFIIESGIRKIVYSTPEGYEEMRL